MANEWLNIDKEPPPDGDLILMLEPFGDSVGGDVHLGCFDGELLDTSGDALNVYISHYMLMPETASIVDKLIAETAIDA